MENRVELLAPAGCENNFYGAVNYGADAVYLGLSEFSARKNAGNFTFERLEYIVAYAHLFNVKVYVAVNTVIKNSELKNYFNAIKHALDLGVDAFIVQDLFLGRVLKQAFPNIVLHLSTQAGVNNVDGAKQAISYGFKRIVLARETSFKEIKKISKIVETEVFIHGALCTCFSGHCYFSSFIGGKSGNRGACRQPCRKLYKYHGKSINDDYRYALSLSDLALPKKVDELIMAGVKSFKIEGRMRSFEYVSTVCDFYRELLDGNFNKYKFDSLKRFYNRGDYTEGLGFSQNKTLISDKIQNHAGVVIAKISSINGKKLGLSSLKCKINEGDCFKIIHGGKEIGSAMAFNENNSIVVKYNNKAVVGSDLAITKDVALSEKLKDKKVLHEVKSVLYVRVGEKLKLTVNGNEYFSDYEVTPAITSAVTKSEVKENLRKVDVYPFSVTPSCDMIEGVFIPKKVLNGLRALAYKEYFYSFANSTKTQNGFDVDSYIDGLSNNKVFNKKREFTIISNDFSFKLPENVLNLVFCPNDYNDLNECERFFNQTKNSKVNKYLYVPPFLSGRDEEIVKNFSKNFDGLYCESASGLFLAKRLKKQFFGGIELNVTNTLTYSALERDGANQICISKELADFESLNSSEWRLSFGDIKVMTLIYCPFGKTCATCKRENRFVLKDEDGREFPVRRYKLSNCIFEVYNNALLRSKKSFNREVLDLTMHSSSECEKLLAIYLENKQNDKFNFTIGNLAKGVE